MAKRFRMTHGAAVSSELRGSRQGVPDFLAKHWRGQGRLMTAFWLIAVLGSLGVQMLGNIMNKVYYIHPVWLVLFLLIPYQLYSLVCVWRCASNTSWQGWTLLSRVLVAFIVLATPVSLSFCLLIAFGPLFR
jgi:hypothetical protein